MKYVIIIIGLLFSTNISSQIVATMYGGVGGSTLYIGLVAAWGLNEASGTIYDYTTNNYTLIRL